MEFYKFLFENKYLETKYENSSISLKGAQKLSAIFEDAYEFIKIEIINESEFFQEFETFNEISQKFIKGNKKFLLYPLMIIIILLMKKINFMRN